MRGWGRGWAIPARRERAPGRTRGRTPPSPQAFGLTNARSRYVYLSDGGHFENLGLHEMVQRRCRTIVVLDGGCDAKFAYEDLGNALRKIRIDLDTHITFSDGCIAPLRAMEKRCAVAEILYPGGERGHLIYVEADGGGQPAA